MHPYQRQNSYKTLSLNTKLTTIKNTRGRGKIPEARMVEEKVP